MTALERKQLKYLKAEKERLVDSFIGACEEINAQIKDVKSGEWRRRMLDGSEGTSEGYEIHGQDSGKVQDRICSDKG